MFHVRVVKHMKIDPVETICLKTKKITENYSLDQFCPALTFFEKVCLFYVSNATDVLSNSFASVIT